MALQSIRSLEITTRQDTNMIEYKHGVVSPEDCAKIIEIAETLPNWNRIYNGPSSIGATKCYVKPYIIDILSKLDMDIPENCCVEVVKYVDGSSNTIHVDAEGDHALSQDSWIRVEWKKTGIILLNDTFEGGELFFPSLSMAFDKTAKGNLILFTAGKGKDSYAHGVNKVFNGTRYTLVFRYI